MGAKPGGSRREGVDPRTKLEAYFAATFSNIQGALASAVDDNLAIRVKARGAYDWLAVATRAGDDGAPEVCFGAGENFWGAVAGLNASMARGGWKPDRYARGEGLRQPATPPGDSEDRREDVGHF